MQTHSLLVEYQDRLDEISEEEHLKGLHFWLFRMEAEGHIASVAEWLNTYMSVRPSSPMRLQPVLPAMTVGSTQGVVMVSANPAFTEETKVEKQLAGSSPEAYWRVARNFFTKNYLANGIGPNGARFWNKALRLAPLVTQNQMMTPLAEGSWQSRLTAAEKTGLLGGWDVFPFHSSRDPFAPFLRKHPDDPVIRPLAEASLNALVRLRPTCLVVAVSSGPQLFRTILPDADWREQIAGPDHPNPVHTMYTRVSGTEIIVWNRNVCGGGHHCGYPTLMETLGQLRSSFEQV